MIVGNVLRFAWEHNEAVAPPFSFRKLPVRPVFSDLYKPKAPYMRRAVIDGSYTDNEHYLDVLFRLMREDMIAPLRDGLYSRKIECGSGRAITSSNDFKVYPMIEVGALQVRRCSGIAMRVIPLSNQVMAMITEENHLKYGNCVVLSSDNFEKEFHIGWICDAFQEDGMPRQNRMAVSFFDEEQSIDRSATYCLVESPVYFEAYRDVLSVLRKMRRFVPFPLERYLVFMKTNTRLPAYMRCKEAEEDEREDRERTFLYCKMRSEEENRLRKKKQEIMERASKAAATIEDNEQAVITKEEDLVTNQDGERDSDGGFDTDQEDYLPTGGRSFSSHPNPKDLETISIQGKSYSVDRLEEHFKTESLDESQRIALCYALKSELALIQGPPGTGKTHLAVEIVMAMLENRIKWRITEPIFIVAFSNQALDNLLEKLKSKVDAIGLEGAPSIVRFGSRSDNEVIKLSCLMLNAMVDYEASLVSVANMEKRKQEKSKCHTHLLRLMRAVKIVQTSRRSISSFNVLRSCLSANHEMQLRQMAARMQDSSGNPLNMDEVMACWLLDKNYATKPRMPTNDSAEDDEEEEVRRTPRVENLGVRNKWKETQGKDTIKDKKERKQPERRQWRDGEDSSNYEEEDEKELSSFREDIDVLQDEEGEEESLRSLLHMMNVQARDQQESKDKDLKWNRDAEKYEVDMDWELDKAFARKNNGRSIADDMEIFSNTVKDGPLMRGRDRKINVDANMVRDIREQKQYILAKEPLSYEEASSVQDVLTLPKERRWRLLAFWQESLSRVARSQLDQLCKNYQKAYANADAAMDNCRVDVCKRALIVGATTTGAAKRRKLLAKIGPKILIVEEAAQVLEAHVLASIVPSVQHAIFIGDHQQLRPMNAVDALAKQANIDVSLFERLVKNGYPYQTLSRQHRMLTPLTELIVRPFFYPKVTDAPSVRDYPAVKGMVSSLFFWAHDASEDPTHDSMSRKNIVEAEMCRNLANYLILQGQYKASEITIICAYAAQVVEIRRRLQMVESEVRDVSVETVDSFQGKENRIIILSLVRSRSGGVGFLGIANRITVALTRAQHGFYCIGNFMDIAKHSSLWSSIVDSLNESHLIDYVLPVKCQRHNFESGIAVNVDFERKTPLGGCDQICAYRMECGHKCPLICHAPHQHERNEVECMEVCGKLCEKCDQSCTRRCNEPCGSCQAVIMLELQCGHSVKFQCGARALARCKEPCSVILSCGHECQNKCSVECVKTDQCEVGVQYTHPLCGHVLTLPCYKLSSLEIGHSAFPACYEKCSERLVCNHKCPLNCGELCPTFCEKTVRIRGECGHLVEKKCSESPKLVKCKNLVPSEMPHCSHKTQTECYVSKTQNECRSTCRQLLSCGHRCTLSCGECYKRASVHECSAPCKKRLMCGHSCQGNCGKPCICLSLCRNRCSHQRCGAMNGYAPGGKNSFARKCSEPCVLCLQPCDNHCEHRSCSRKCYEVCDVSACSAQCRKLLRCGHACLGLCGEPCPNLCGTCLIAAYKSLIEKYADDDVSTVKRLVQMPDCGHIFPHKYMDNEVRRQVEKGETILRCPEELCGKTIDECRRYSKQHRSLWLEADIRKWEGRLAAEEMSRAVVKVKYTGIRSEMVRAHGQVLEIIKSYGGKKDNGHLVAFYLYRLAETHYNKLMKELQTKSALSLFYYWQSVVSCYKCIVGLISGYLAEADRIKVAFCLDHQMNLRSVIDEAYERKRARVAKIKDHFQEMVMLVENSLGDRKVGALVPHFRLAMVKCALHFHIERMHSALGGRKDENKKPIDLSNELMASLKRVIKSILNGPPSDHPDKQLEELVKSLNVNVYEKLLKCPNLIRAPFNCPLPEF